MLGTPPPYNFSTSGVHPLHTSVLGIRLTKTLQLRYFGCAPPPYLGSRITVPETNQVSTVLGPPPSSVLMYFSLLECLTSYRPFVVLCLGFEPGRCNKIRKNILSWRRYTQFGYKRVGAWIDIIWLHTYWWASWLSHSRDHCVLFCFMWNTNCRSLSKTWYEIIY